MMILPSRGKNAATLKLSVMLRRIWSRLTRTKMKRSMIKMDRQKRTVMLMSLNLKTPPAVEPVSLDEVKNHLRLDLTDTSEDALIQTYIESARDWCEGYNGRVFITQTWEYFLDDVPNMPLEFPVVPLVQVNSITLTDNDGTITTIDPVNYVVDAKSRPGRIAFTDGYAWPGVQLVPLSGLKIEADCGIGTAVDVPSRYKTRFCCLPGISMSIGRKQRRRRWKASRLACWPWRG